MFRRARIFAAVPVASAHACVELRGIADGLVCLADPEPLLSVGQWYQDFRQISDREVQDLVEQAALRQLAFQEMEFDDSRRAEKPLAATNCFLGLGKTC